ncbi:MAG: phosphate ABC transporter substrate-binding protein [bacterium]
MKIRGGMNIQKFWITIVIVCCIIGTFAGARAGELNAFKDIKGVIKIAGGTAHIPVMQEAAKRIIGFNPDIQITIAGGGSGVGIKQVGEGLVDIGNSGRKPTDEEINKYNLTMHKWAVDGVGIIVNPHNTVKELTKEQVSNIFSGKINNWKQVGGEDREINLYTRDVSSGTRDVFWKEALDKGEISSKANFIASNGAMKTAISQDPYGIGYISVGHIDETVSAVSFNSISPTLENVREGKYTIARGLYSNTKGKPYELTEKFINFLYTPEGQKIIESKGFIPIK